MNDEDHVTSVPLRQQSRWRRLFKEPIGTYGAILSTLTFVAYVATNLWKWDDLVVYFRFPEPTEVGTTRLDLNFVFSNAGKTSVFIEDVSVIEIVYQKKPNNAAAPDFGLCKDRFIFPPSFMALLPLDTRRLPVVDDKGMQTTFYTPASTYLDGVQSKFASLNIDVGKQRAISAIFDTVAVDWSKFNIVLLCPVVRFFDASGQSRTAICGGWQTDDVYFDVLGDPRGRRSATAPVPVRLLPTYGNKLSRCVKRFYGVPLPCAGGLS